ncbi:factor-independent urate hydroxylase [Halalkalibacter nanhaiisediminis]|uniref:Uricase n=1 Tax=Halalkalibacter nanhaiisediminis TaxID=688079 RepID=A0A562QCP9_9BACI|nr:urate oxidase [Halalkalibacter nanhaiisediminis]TWI54532.1 urate oxidase [Halalkalibacter nanhaiisediminis]
MKTKSVQKVATKRTMYYGKADVFVYRTYAKPLKGIREIPESSFRGRSNIIFGMDIQVAIKGNAFLSSFTEGDNTQVVATDSMKNFILRHAGDYTGATMEGFLEFVSKEFLQKYPHIEAVTMSGQQFPFNEVEIPTESGFAPSELVFRQGLVEQPSASVQVERTADDQYEVIEQTSGVKGLRLIKVKGSSFYGYIKDEYTTLPESFDRPLFIYLDINWHYEDTDDAKGDQPDQYVCAEQVAHIAQTLFHQEDSPSIQNLIYKIGLRVLKRFPQLAEISFVSNNRTWETIVEEVSYSADGKVFTDPRPPYGFQGFSVTKEDLALAEAEEEK